MFCRKKEQTVLITASMHKHSDGIPLLFETLLVSRSAGWFSTGFGEEAGRRQEPGFGTEFRSSSLLLLMEKSFLNIYIVIYK
jgi:hypothetical protein